MVDDGSRPPVDPSRQDRLTNGRVLRRQGRGPAAARNAGAAAARGAYLLFTDDDTEAAPTWLDAACEFLERHRESVGVEGPVTVAALRPALRAQPREPRPGAYWTCNIAYRRAAFERLGGFHEDFPAPHCEDLDLAYRASELGPIGFAPGMATTHFPRSAPLRGWIARAQLTRSEALLFRRHPERFGRSARVPPRLFPIVGALYSWARQFREQAPALLRSPPARSVRRRGEPVHRDRDRHEHRAEKPRAGERQAVLRALLVGGGLQPDPADVDPAPHRARSPPAGVRTVPRRGLRRSRGRSIGLLAAT